MKSLYILVLLLVQTVAYSQNSENKMAFLDLRGRDCNGGSGICSSALENNKAYLSSASFAKLSENKLQITVPLDYFEKVANNNAGFDKNRKMMLQDEDFLLSKVLLQYFGFSSKQNIIAKGWYPYSVTKNGVAISFVLQ